MEPSLQSSPDTHEQGNSRGVSRASKRPAPRGTAAYPRQRAVTACQVCRARRTKCDNALPKCSFCAKTGAECISSPTTFSSFDPASLKILERLDELETLVRSSSLPHGGGVPDPVQISTLPRPPTTASTLSKHIPESPEAILKWPVFQERYTERAGLTTLLSAATPSIRAYSPTTSSSYPPVEEFDHKTCTRLLEKFLRNVHIKNPLFEESYLRQLMRRICLDGISHDVQSCLALLVCALGCIAVPFESSWEETQDRVGFAQAQAYFNAAQKRMGLLWGSSGVYVAQCFFWSGVYFICMMQPLSAWRMFMQALTCCQTFRFAARSPLASPGGSDDASPSAVILTLEERVYWSCWKSERELRAEIQPPDFKMDILDYPRSFPTPPQNSAGMEHVSWCFYLAEISLLRLRIAAQNDILSAGSTEDGDFFDALAGVIGVHESQIESWTHSLPEVITLEQSQTDDDILKFILRGHRLNSYEMLYSVFVRYLIMQGHCPPNATTSAIKGLQVHVDRLEVNRPGFKHRHHGTWGMLRSCTRSALVLLAAAHHPQARELIPDGWQDAVVAAIDMLDFWRHEVNDADDRAKILRELWDELQTY